MTRLTCLLVATLAVAPACGDGDSDSHDHDDHDHGVDAGTAPDAATAATPAQVWYFGAEVETNTWSVTVFDPTEPTQVMEAMAVDELAALSGPADSGGNGAGPIFNDSTAATDHSRIFVNARSVNRVAVFDTATRSLETVLDVGERPVHLFNPNHGDEVWVHADGPGAFYVIDQTSLAVSDPIVAALDNTGHGKLLYAEQLGTNYYATNTNDPGAFPIDGAARTVGDIISVCDAPCEDDPATPEDESLLTCGSTHDKAYNPGMNYVVFQCSGANRGTFGFVDAATNEVVADLVPVAGSVAHSPGNEYIVVIDGDVIQIWDTGADGHDGIAFDAQVTLTGEPSARGAQFWQNANGDWEAWIPQTAGTAVSVVNLRTLDVEDVDIGPLTKPEGASHFSRRADIGGNWFFTYNDTGAVTVDLTTRAVTQGPSMTGLPTRVTFVDPTAHQ